MMWKLAIMALAAAAMADSASAEGLARGALKDTMFPYICTDAKTAHQETVVFAQRPDGIGHMILPLGASATRRGNIFTAVTAGGTFSINGTSFIFITDDEVRSGPCVAIGEPLDEMIGMMEETSPDAFDKLTAAYLAPWAAEKAKAEADAEIAKAVAVAEAKVRAASAISHDNDRLRRENDKLKARICLLDPKATFSICPDVRAGAKP